MTEAEWLACADPEPLLEFLREQASRRKQILFGLACCRRIAHVSSDPRARTALIVADHFIEGRASTSDLTTVHSALGDAVQEAWYERYAAEASANFCSHPGYSAALASESAVYAIGGVFDQLSSELTPTLERGYGTEGGPHQKAVWAASGHFDALMLLIEDRMRSPEQRITNHELREGFRERVSSSESLVQAALLRDIFGNPFRPVTFDPAWRTETVMSLASQMYESRDFGAMPIIADALQDAGCDCEEVLSHGRGPGPHVRGCWVVDRVLGK